MQKLTMLLLLLALPLLFAGCTPKFTNIYNMELSGERIAGMGDVFFDHSEGWGFEGGTEPFFNHPFRFELIVVELTNEKMGLQYNEFTKLQRMGTYGPTTMPDWVIKQGFNKRLDYVLADKVIHFKDFGFEIISVDKGQIKYRRIK